MAPKPKASGAKKRPAKATIPKAKEKPQRERFIEAARERGITREEFEMAITRLVPPLPGPRNTRNR